MAQVLEVFTAAGNGFLLLGTVHVVVIGAHTVVTVAIGLQVPVLVTIDAGQGDMGQRLAAGRLATAGRHAQQAASFDRCHSIELFAQPTNQVGI
ncbi:hypothetical protein D3C76_1358640 [compost metagenome]